MAYGPIIVPVSCDTSKCRYPRVNVEIGQVDSLESAIVAVTETAIREGWEITPRDAQLPLVACPDHRITPLPPSGGGDA